MDYEQLISLAIFASVGAVTPGPNNIILAATGSQVGFRKGLPTLLGVVCGFLPLCFIITLTIGNAAANIDNLFTIIKIIGFALLLWLSYKIASAPIDTLDIKDDADLTAINKKTKSKKISNPGFVSMFLWQWLNPKSWIVVSTAISLYINPAHDILDQALHFLTAFAVATLFAATTWLSFGALLKRFLRQPLWQRLLNLTMAVLLLASVLPVYFL
ncbi:MAG: LysE family translocator [Alphaproteobacteria bacterium]|nr:LysE family translocator [Alphaproteobacteria bacterium]